MLPASFAIKPKESKMQNDLLLETLKGLLKWESTMGGFESPVWERAREVVARATIQVGSYVRYVGDCGEACEVCRIEPPRWGRNETYLVRVPREYGRLVSGLHGYFAAVDRDNIRLDV
jgi:hypothetical protein